MAGKRLIRRIMHKLQQVAVAHKYPFNSTGPPQSVQTTPARN